MPSSASIVSLPKTASGALAAAARAPRPFAASLAHFGVVPFRRDPDGAIVSGAAVEVPNGDIAWRRARAEAFEHGNVGAVVLSADDFATPGHVRNGILLASFGDVDLSLLAE